MHVGYLPRVLEAATTPTAPPTCWGNCEGLHSSEPFLVLRENFTHGLSWLSGAAFLEKDNHWLVLPESRGQPKWLPCVDQALQVGTEEETPPCITISRKKRRLLN